MSHCLEGDKMFLKVKTYKSKQKPNEYVFVYVFSEEVIINTEEITSIKKSNADMAVNVDMDGVPGKKLYEIYLPLTKYLVDQEDADKIFNAIGTSI